VPFTRVSLIKGKSSEYKQAILQNIYTAMRETFNVPEDDRFMVIHEHEVNDFVYGKNYLNVSRSDDLVMIQITANDTRTVEQKKALYSRIVELLSDDPGIRPEDIFIGLVEVKKENWSFGYGLAQYVDPQ
jgi:4-oxalocrotonate tautomerase